MALPAAGMAPSDRMIHASVCSTRRMADDESGRGRPETRQRSQRVKRPSPDPDPSPRDSTRRRRRSAGDMAAAGSVAVAMVDEDWHETAIGGFVDVPLGCDIQMGSGHYRNWNGGPATVVTAQIDHITVRPGGANSNTVPIRVDFARGQRRSAAAGLTPYTVPSRRSRSTSPTPRGSPDATPRPATKQMQVDGADSGSEQESSPQERPAASPEIQMGMSPVQSQDAVEEAHDSWGHGPEAEGESAGPKRFSLFDDDEDAEHVSSAAAAASMAGRGEAEGEEEEEASSTKVFVVSLKDEFSLHLRIDRLDNSPLIGQSRSRSQSKDVLEVFIAALKPHFEKLLYTDLRRVDVELLSFAKHGQQFQRAIEQVFADKRIGADGNRVNPQAPDAPEYSKETMQVWSAYVDTCMSRFNPGHHIWLSEPRAITVNAQYETYDIELSVCNRSKEHF